MRLGPFVLQGMFLKRQREVSEEFAECLTEKLFTSESLWHHMLNGPKSEAFAKLLHARTQQLMGGAAAVLYGGAQPTEFAGGWWTALEARVSGRVLALLPQARHAHRTPRIFPLARHKALHKALHRALHRMRTACAPHVHRMCSARARAVTPPPLPLAPRLLHYP